MSSPKDDVKRLTGKVRTDHYIWGIFLFILLFSVIELFSASIQEIKSDNIYEPLVRHVIFLVAGVICMLLLERTHYKRIYAAIPWFVILSVLAMAYVMVDGTKINGVRRAIQFGHSGPMLLPAEFLKLSVALGVAWLLGWCQEPGRRDVTTRGFVYTLVFLGLCCFLLFSQGLTNTLLVVAIGGSMMLVSGVSWKKIGLTLLIFGFLGGGAFLVKTVLAPTKEATPQQVEIARLNKEEIDLTAGAGRGSTWLGRLQRHFRADKYNYTINDLNKQEQISFMAQAHGGLRGVGIGHSRENARLPLAFSDYIYAIVVEELGVVLAVALLAAYLALLGRAGRLLLIFKHTLLGVLVIGCACVIVFQALFHMAIVTGFFPVSGQPLPLISKGGTSVLATCIALGIMLSVSRHAERYNDNNAVRQRLEELPDDLVSTPEAPEEQE